MTTVTTPADVSKDARIIFLMLTDGHATEAVLSAPEGILSRLLPGTIVVNMSTISPKQAVKEDRMVRDAGGSYLDIPVSGSVIPAQNGQLLLLAGGPEEKLSSLAPILTTLGRETLHLGDVGAGMTGKLVINTLLAAQMEALAQTLVLGEDLGFDREKVLDLVFKSPLSCAFYQLKKDNLTNRDYPKAFSVALMEKDLALAEEECSGRAISPVFAQEVRAPFKKARDRGMGDLDLSSVFEIFRSQRPS
jgi:3-hydroxyisobutyrate dehydrogenase